MSYDVDESGIDESPLSLYRQKMFAGDQHSSLFRLSGEKELFYSIDDWLKKWRVSWQFNQNLHFSRCCNFRWEKFGDGIQNTIMAKNSGFK